MRLTRFVHQFGHQQSTQKIRMLRTQWVRSGLIVKMVPKGGLEPPTRGFLVRSSYYKKIVYKTVEYFVHYFWSIPQHSSSIRTDKNPHSIWYIPLCRLNKGSPGNRKPRPVEYGKEKTGFVVSGVGMTAWDVTVFLSHWRIRNPTESSCLVD